MEAVVVEFVLDPQEHTHRAGQPEGEACDVEQRIAFVAVEVAEGDLEVVAEHDGVGLMG
jgi:hypothetical protein